MWICKKHCLPFLLGFLFLEAAIALAQEDSTSSIPQVMNRHEIGFSLGKNIGYLKDLNFAPLHYRENGTIIALSYLRKTNHPLVGVDLEYDKGGIHTDATGFFDSKYLAANLNLFLLWRMPGKNKRKLSFFLGPEYHSFFEFVEWNDLDSWTYFGSHGLNLKGLVTYDINPKNRFQSYLSTTLLTALVRPPYNGVDQHIIKNQERTQKLAFSGTVVSINTYQTLMWDTIYRFAASQHLDFVLSYFLRYQRISGFNKVVHLQHQTSIGIIVKF